MSEGVNDKQPFEKLSDDEKKSATDIVIAISILNARLPSLGQDLFDKVITEFANTNVVSRNVVRYAMQDLGRSLYEKDWDYKIIKTGQALVTEFKPCT